MRDWTVRGVAESGDERRDLRKWRAPGKDKIILENVDVSFQMVVDKVAERDAQMTSQTFQDLHGSAGDW